jgi:hypothetical protein
MLHLRAVFFQICHTDRVGKQACIRVSIFRSDCSRLSKFIRQRLVCIICPQQQSVDVGLLLLYPSYRDLDYGSENSVKYTARSRSFGTYSSFTITRYTTSTTKHSTNNMVIFFKLWEGRGDLDNNLIGAAPGTTVREGFCSPPISHWCCELRRKDSRSFILKASVLWCSIAI